MTTTKRRQQKMHFDKTIKIDKIQLSIGRSYFKELKINCDKFLKFVALKYIPDEDREIYQYRMRMFRIDVVRYAARNPIADKRHKIWISFKMYNPTTELQEFILNNILDFIPAETYCRHLTNIEFALDIFPKNIQNVQAILKTLTSHATIKFARGDNIKVIGHSIKIGDSQDDTALIAYPKPKKSLPTYVRLEIRFYRDSIPRLFKDNRNYTSPITEINPLDHIVFRKHCNIEKLRAVLKRKIRKVKRTFDKACLGVRLMNLEQSILGIRVGTRIRLNPVCRQLKFYRERIKRLGIQDKTDRYFEIITQIAEDIKKGFLVRKY